ncbi:hypothetical protein SIL08_01020 [Scandinavium sp. V105_16]|uniref:Lipoprotein n=1 Tax=Scandinavium lactucae TaxID=3095028 RepID=A0AAJ2VQT5_9ENTR|nr:MULTISPECIES: hypothetical protein [unclassified Scandinavium]MDX6018878.1 hypothetical protein [Scandinavium sp. V105_16]MDX6030160.1 hypothetical protein [Scandinavium sp. V105_12]
MYNKTNTWGLSFVLLMVSGCSNAVDKTLSPPSDAQWVNVEVKNPSPYTKPFPLELRYISHECLKKRVSGFDGSTITEPSYNVVAIPMQQGAGEHWQGKVARNGGGACKWTLSAINLGIEYTDATHLGKDLVPGTAVGATIAFDDDASRNGYYKIINGNEWNYSPLYFPFVKRWAIGGGAQGENKLYLFGENASFLQVYLHGNEDEVFSITYSPSIDESKKVEMLFPKEKGHGATYTFIYPNGEHISSREIKPDFNKVDSMSIK